ncbi:phosphatase PAP2 family protein [Skermania sp. ID1734]|uniref:phosphatase PAP2 family protein n=1 Tax=Skermania sp. ID1734 TaxID=2597516 RepID=UPI0011810D4E|nr:phosphatase PAP2 family protein [Skermania sp. ID1734]TSD96615.1 phosphatase PAP2 family protein [Skermania sp. ID1734]
MPDNSLSPGGLIDQFRDHLIPEIRSEAATAEIALWVLSLCGALLIVSAFALLRNHRANEASKAAEYGWRVVQVVALVVAYLQVAFQVARSGWLTHADKAVLNWFVEHRSGFWTVVAKTITDVGSPAGVAIIGIGAACYVSWRRRAIVPGLLLVGTIGIAATASTVTKVVVGRHRPPAITQLISETDFSFPSGHVTGTTALVGAIVLVYGADRSGRWRWTGMVLSVVPVVIVASTRLYLGVHWFTDVVGGALLGSTAVAIGALVAVVIAPMLGLSPKVSAGERRELDSRPVTQTATEPTKLT